MLKHRRNRVSERIAQQDWSESQRDRTHKDWTLKHQEYRVEEKQRVDWLSIDACNYSDEDGTDCNAKKNSNESTNLADSQFIEESHEQVFGVLAALVAARIFLFEIKLLTAMVDLIGSHTSEKLILLLSFVLIGVVAAAPNHADQVCRHSCVGFFIVNSPIFVLISEITGT